jgi:hypothetical protein
MRRYLAAPAYVLGLMTFTFGLFFSVPFTSKGPPGTYVEPVQVDPSLDFPIKDQSRVPSAPIQPVRVATVSYRYDPPVQKAALNATHERATLPWSCDMIRQAASSLTRKQQERLARVARLSDEQKAEAMRCLRKRT